MFISELERTKYISQRLAAGIAREHGILDSPFEQNLDTTTPVSRKAVSAYVALMVGGENAAKAFQERSMRQV